MMDNGTVLLKISFSATVIYWRGPAPFFFVAIPSCDAEAIRDTARSISYGWGMVPVVAEIVGFGFSTALFPKDDSYLLPLKAKVRDRIGVDVDDTIAVTLRIQRLSLGLSG